jgi:hypothetical protein
MDNIFCFIYWIRDFNTEFRLKSLFWVYYLTPSFSIRFPVLSTESEYPNQGSIQRNGALIFVQIPKCGNPVMNSK